MSETDQMSFLQHLEELRWRVIRAAIAILVFASAAFIFKGIIFDQIILAPKKADFITYRIMCALSHKVGMTDALCITSDFELQNISMSGQFTSHIIVSILAGLVFAFPYVFFQLWAFIKPGLKVNEKTMARGVVFFTTLLFMIGIAFGYFLIAPLSIQFLGGYQVSEQVNNIITLNSFITTVTTTTLASGVVFQLPMVIYFLAKVGLVTPQSLKTYRKHALVGILILAAIITPPDITSQILVTLPLYFLYEVSIHIARIVVKKNERNELKPDNL